jgi:hypothetical protein
MMDGLQIHLQRIYDLTWERLRYAESKNGAVMAVTSLIFFRMLDSSHVYQGYFKSLYFLSLVFFSTTIIVCVYSFVPVLNIPKLMGKKHKKMPSNFGDFNNLLSSIRLGSYDPKEYAESLATKINLLDKEILPIDMDYAEHIIVNSKIVLFKFKCFQIAMVCMLFGMILGMAVKIAPLLFPF